MPWRRYLAALLRFRWLIIAITLLGTAAGFGLSRLMTLEYEVSSTIWISAETPQARGSGPIRAQELLNASGWPELLRSFAVLDRVVDRLGLYLVPRRASDAPIFERMGPAAGLRAGRYDLRMENGRFALYAEDGSIIDSGMVGDSIGRPIGLRWAPSTSLLSTTRNLEFAIVHPRTVSVALAEHIDADLPPNSSLLRAKLRGTDPEILASTLNVIVDEFVHVAADLKKRHLVESARQLERQVEYAYGELRSAEIALEGFRVSTITLPAEGGPVAGGIEMTRNPVFANFFEQKIELDNVQRDREAIERTLAAVQRGDLQLNAFWAIPSVQSVGRDLAAALADYSSKEAAFRALQHVYTDEHPNVREQRRILEALRDDRIPPVALALVEQLRVRESELATRIASASRELREIPTRTIEEARLKLNRQTRENLYVMLRNRYEEARLAEASVIADVVALDAAVTPERPMRTAAARLIGMALIGSAGFAVLLGLLLDRLDPRFRYPEQVTGELGLTILGAVPSIGAGERRAGSEEGMQIVEAFRGIRLALAHALSSATAVQITVTSPTGNDGKSLVSANLALSFAEAGYRTLLIDGDTRRGGLHTAFERRQTPGLIDYLLEQAELEETLRDTSHTNLTLLPAGSRTRRAPELLASRRLVGLLSSCRERFDVVITDSPPLAAGIDAFVLGTITGSVLLVMRAGETDRHLAKAKLETFGRLPARVLGVVLNDIRATGIYRYYSYSYGYAQLDESPAALSFANGWGRFN